MNWGKIPPPKLHADIADAGYFITVAIEFNGKRAAVRVENPLWREIDAAWHEAHPEHES